MVGDAPLENSVALSRQTTAKTTTMLRPAVAITLNAVFLCLAGDAAFGARYVPVEVTVNGEVILKGNLSDDGSRDADELWKALKAVDLNEAEGFGKLQVAPDLMDYKIVVKSDRAQALLIQINVKYGGIAQMRSLTIRRLPPDRSGGVWRISAQDVDDSFDDRMLSRRLVAQLADPKLKKERVRTDFLSPRNR